MLDLKNYRENFEKAMDDDFNMPQAMAEIFNMVHSGNSIAMNFSDKDNDTIRYTKLKYARDVVSKYIAEIFGLFLKEENDTLSPVERILFNERNDFRKTKNFKKADELRQILLNQYNIIIEDTKEGPTWRRKISNAAYS